MKKPITFGEVSSGKRGYIIDLLLRLRYDIPALPYFLIYVKRKVDIVKNYRIIQKRLN